MEENFSKQKNVFFQIREEKGSTAGYPVEQALYGGPDSNPVEVIPACA